MITIISDCQDANAFGRQVARASSLLNRPVNLIGVNSDLEAAGNLIDIIEAVGEHDGLILVNVAPRHANAKKWRNGSPFGFFNYKKILVVTTVDGATLSLVKKFSLLGQIKVINMPPTLDKMVEKGLLTIEQRNHIVDSQFRSFDFVPRVAAHIVGGNDVIAEQADVQRIIDADKSIWWVDNFGNCKTTLLESDIEVIEGFAELGKIGRTAFFPRLKDVPDGETAVVVGSSGLGDKRFLEIVVQSENASKKLGLKSGDSIF